MNDMKVFIVLAMFPLAKSKHLKKDYEIWLLEFLEVITTDFLYNTRISRYSGGCPRALAYHH
jgi:hypothetical protein